ncbi:TniB family NTP-binding protein [Phycicoccus sp. M110.8]|uniref:TniB family NTP-binding protein n=1 Tax=Phycicoccus sp. M110.8 TaxID=3075433 RepID=UPI0028FDB616|nr:TniB family NTP-binding protein [Phycicoccus sp. M110.8]MDU0314115.1 TniB family NTP-binding protein [Phycicoccus sp. M110.8]
MAARDSLVTHWPDPLAGGADPLAEPPLAEPWTKTAWRRYLDRTEPAHPPKVTRQAYDRMSLDRAAAYDRARDRYHSSLAVFNTPLIDALSAKLGSLLAINQHAQPGARTGLVVSGPTRIGKSTAVKALLADYERSLRTRHPDYFVRRGDEYVPVGYLQMPEKASVKALLQTLAVYYELDQPDKATTTLLQHVVTKAMSLSGTSILVIDDLHFLDVGKEAGQEANNMLKALANTTGATFVAIGVDLEAGQLFTEGPGNSRKTQTSGRYSLLSPQRYQVNTKAAATSWVNLVKTFEDHLVLLDQPVNSITEHWQYLHRRTGGSICSLSQLMREAAFRVQGTGFERITVETLDEITIDYASEYEFRKHLEELRDRAVSTTRRASGAGASRQRTA